MQASAVIDRVVKGFRRHDNPDLLNGDIDSSVVNVPFRGILKGWGPGGLIEIGSEIMLVVEVDTGSQIATVIRGWLNTTAGPHSENDPIFINPRIFRSDVLDLMNDCLEDLIGKDLYTVAAEEKAYDPALIGYSIPEDALDVLRVDGLKDSFSQYWEPIYDWLEVDNTDTADFSTGKALMLRTALPPGAFRIIYSAAFTRIAVETDDMETQVGLRLYMTDLPFYYSMSRLMVDLERNRSQIKSAEGHQRAQDVPAFLALRTGEWYQARYEDRIRVCRSRLLKETKRVRGTGYGS